MLVLGARDAQNPRLFDHFRGEVRLVVLSSQCFRAQVIERGLCDHEPFIAGADGDFAAEDQVKGIRIDAPSVQDWIKHVGRILHLVHPQASLRVHCHFLLL